MVLLTTRDPESCAVARDVAEENGVVLVVHGGKRGLCGTWSEEAWTQSVGEADGGGWGNGWGIGFGDKNTANHASGGIVMNMKVGRGCGVRDGSGSGDGHGTGHGFGRARRSPK